MRALNTATIRLTKAGLLLSDVVALCGAAVLAAASARYISDVAGLGWIGSQDVRRYVVWGVVALSGLLVFLTRYRHYAERKPFWSELAQVFRVVAAMALVDLAVMALTRWNASRLWWLFMWPMAAILIPLGRAWVRRFMRQRGWWQRPTLVIGCGTNALEAMAALQSEPAMGFDLVGFVDASAIAPDAPTGNSLRMGQRSWPLWPLAVLADWAKRPGVQFVVALEHGQNDLRENILRDLARWKAQDVSVIPAMRGVPLYGTDMSYFFSHEVALLKLRNNLRYWPARWLKRAFDVSVAAVLITLLWPLMLYLALRIRHDGGPAVFAHQRVGQQGNMFPCYKFRSMAVDADMQLERLLQQDPALRAQWEQDHKLKDDPRITLVGQFLRKTSLDELPQLFNVIRGEMSLVGPRPIVQAEVARYGDDVDYFLMVRPGITGLWQVSGRNDTGYDTRVYLDTWYVKNWSLWYDIAILFKTVRVVLKRKGAY